jgi:membrane protease YdiL (CAAX protease family)
VTPVHPSPVPLSPAERRYRWFELIALFYAIPLVLCFRTYNIPIFPLLWIAALGSIFLLIRDPSFDRTQIWNASAIKRGLPRILSIWILCTTALIALVWFLSPNDLFSFPRERPRIWLAVMLFYPVLSVIPQGLVYRVFVFHRYGGLFPSVWARILAAAVTFAFAHVVFESPTALSLTFAGGLLFSYTYSLHRSGLLASIEHALYGMTVFTLGLGRHLYLGGVSVPG